MIKMDVPSAMAIEAVKKKLDSSASLAGAGISKERGNEWIWKNHGLEGPATPEAFKKGPEDPRPHIMDVILTCNAGGALPKL